MIRILSLILLVSLFSCSTDTTDQIGADASLFSLIPSENSGISFVNQVEDQKDFNILSFRNFYNGGGVAIGDINNDGLEDIYFISNQQPNRLYLNKGNMVFEDITEKANVEGGKKWSTGVAMTDVNADGLLDIYVLNSGPFEGDDRRNELFVNNGDLTFTESAETWGLDSDALSIHATFFDYDLDGDLDCFLLNNSFSSPDKMAKNNKLRSEHGNEGGDRLLRNEGRHFEDITRGSGIHSSDIGFGLGVSVSDVNCDMLPDIYISNDFWERDYLYINHGDGTFSDRIETMITKTSLNSMGSDIADINNDGYPEVMTTDMLPMDNYRLKTMTQFEPFRMGTMDFDTLYHQQFMHNNLQLNDHGTHFSEISGIAGVSASDWSWGALILDLDLDGWKDIFVSNGIRKDMTDFDFVDIITNKKVVDQIVEERGGFDFRDFIPFLPETKIPNSVFINQKDLSFKEKAKELGLAQPSFSNGSAYGDLDNDGDLDLVVNNANMECFLYRNNTVERGANNYLKILLEGDEKNPFGVGAMVQISKGGQQQTLQHYLSRGFESSVAPGLIFGLSNVETLDTLRVVWPDKKMQILTNLKSNQTLTLDYQNADQDWAQTPLTSKPIFKDITTTEIQGASKHTENDFNDFRHEPLIYRMISKEGPKILKGDFNGDELEDMIVLGAADDANKLLTQERDGTFSYQIVNAFLTDKHMEATCGAVFDFDNDGDLDIIIGHGGNEIQKGQQNFGLRLYENSGSGNFTLNISSTPQVGGNMSCIEAGDFDNDGNIDLFLGARVVPGNYGLVPSSFLLRNNGGGGWLNFTNQEIGTLGMVTAAQWSDIDNDNDVDLIVVGDWMPITIFENVPGTLKRKGSIKDSYGWWSALEAKDLDGDGDDDYILGNWGLNSKFVASVERPLKLYVKDFDKNGKVDQVLEWYTPADEKAYPFSSKDNMVRSIPSLNKKIEKYDQYGRSNYVDLFDQAQREGALEFKCNYLASAILWRDKTGFRLEALPFDAQVTSISSIVAEDVDNDKITDLLLFGNHFGLKPEIGRLEVNHGIMLKGLKDRSYQPVLASKSGLFIKGEVRDAVMISDTKKELKLIVGKNDMPVQIFKMTDN